MPEDTNIQNVVNKIGKVLDNAKHTGERIREEEERKRASVQKFQSK